MRIFAAIGAAALVLGTGLVAAPPAAGSAAGSLGGSAGGSGATAAGTSVLVEIGAPTMPGPIRRTEPITAWLRCDGWSSNEHPYPERACAELIAAKGDVAAIPPLPGTGCLAYYQPVTIKLVGTVEGVPVRFTDVATNQGCAAISHGHVFRIL
jgi:hypothetical protein